MPAASELQKQYTPEKLQELGQQLYAEKRYAEALEFFDAAIGAVTKPSLTLFNNRAAAHEKLGDLTAALCDGKQMLGLNKGYAPGYLRTGKILRMMDKPDLALKIYERGLRYASVQSQQYATLQKISDKFAQSLAPPKEVDMFQVLPLELLELIFKEVSFKQRCKCLRVSKQWNEFLNGWPSFWRTIDFSLASRPVSAKSVFPYIERANRGVIDIYLKNIQIRGNRMLETLMLRCNKLERLQILTGGELSTSLSSAIRHASNLKILHTSAAVPIDGVALQKILSQCETLSEVRCGSLKWRTMCQENWTRPAYDNLRTYHVDLVDQLQSICNFRYIVPLAHNLTSLAIYHPRVIAGLGLDSEYGYATLSKLENLHLGNLRVAVHMPTGCLSLPKTIRRLHFFKTALFQHAGPLNVSSHLPQLKRLEIEDCGELSLDKVEKLLQSAQGAKLWLLQVAAGPLDRTGLEQIVSFPRLEDLRELYLGPCHNFDDDLAELTAKTLPTIEVLNISSSKITGVAVRTLVTALPKLRHLIIDSCPKVSVDAVEWARSKGLRVDSWFQL